MWGNRAETAEWGWRGRGDGDNGESRLTDDDAADERGHPRVAEPASVHHLGPRVQRHEDEDRDPRGGRGAKKRRRHRRDHQVADVCDGGTEGGDAVPGAPHQGGEGAPPRRQQRLRRPDGADDGVDRPVDVTQALERRAVLGLRVALGTHHARAALVWNAERAHHTLPAYQSKSSKKVNPRRSKKNLLD